MLDFMKVILGVIVVVIIIGFSMLIFEKFVTEKTVTIKVALVEKKILKSGEVYYLIYTQNEIFENRNNSFYGKQNADKLGLNFRNGKSYKVRVVGYNLGVKLPFFLEHRNILDIVSSNITRKF